MFVRSYEKNYHFLGNLLARRDSKRRETCMLLAASGKIGEELKFQKNNDT
jgi:hypothetical protein